MRCRPYQPETYFIKFHFLGFFLYIRNTYFQEHLRVLCIYLFIYFFFLNAMCQARIYYLCFFVYSKSQMPHTCFLQTGYLSTYFSKVIHILKWKYNGIIYLTIYYSTAKIEHSLKFQRANVNSRNSSWYCYIQSVVESRKFYTVCFYCMPSWGL